MEGIKKIAGVTMLICGQSLNICPGCCGKGFGDITINGGSSIAIDEISSCTDFDAFTKNFNDFNENDIKYNVRVFKIGRLVNVFIINSALYNKLRNKNSVRKFAIKGLYFWMNSTDLDKYKFSESGIRKNDYTITIDENYVPKSNEDPIGNKEENRDPDKELNAKKMEMDKNTEKLLNKNSTENLSNNTNFNDKQHKIYEDYLKHLALQGDKRLQYSQNNNTESGQTEFLGGEQMGPQYQQDPEDIQYPQDQQDPQYQQDQQDLQEQNLNEVQMNENYHQQNGPNNIDTPNENFLSNKNYRIIYQQGINEPNMDEDNIKPARRQQYIGRNNLNDFPNQNQRYFNYISRNKGINQFQRNAKGTINEVNGNNIFGMNNIDIYNKEYFNNKNQQENQEIHQDEINEQNKNQNFNLKSNNFINNSQYISFKKDNI